MGHLPYNATLRGSTGSETVFFHIASNQGSRGSGSPLVLPFRKENTQLMTDRRGNLPNLPVNTHPWQAAHGRCQVQIAQDNGGTGQSKICCIVQRAAYKEGVPRRKPI